MATWTAKMPVEQRTVARRLHVLTGKTTSKKGTQTYRHAYLLERDGGNLLFHPPDRVPFYKEHRAVFDDAGGIALQVLTHHGEASAACKFVADTWGADVWVNRWELDAARKEARVEIARGFENDEPLADDVRAVHVPGHAVGHHGYVFELEGARYLVLGHLLEQRANGWTARIPPPMLDAGLRTLAAIKDLEVDWLLPDATQNGPPPPVPFGRGERAEAVASARGFLARKYETDLDA